PSLATCQPVAFVPPAISPPASLIGWFWVRPTEDGFVASPPPPVTFSPGSQKARATDVPGNMPPKRTVYTVVAPDGPVAPVGPAGPVGPVAPSVFQLSATSLVAQTVVALTI